MAETNGVGREISLAVDAPVAFDHIVLQEEINNTDVLLSMLYTRRPTAERWRHLISACSQSLEKPRFQTLEFCSAHPLLEL